MSPELQTEAPIESPIQIPATDGYPLGACLYYSDALHLPQTVAIINCATGVKAAYYARYAKFLAAHGYLAIAYDYRGIGASRPASLRQLRATKFDWGSKDFEGIMLWVIKNFADAKIVVVGHSIGGVLPGFSASNWRIDRLLTVGAQFAYWQDYAEHARYQMLLKWHVLMPLATTLAGFFPGRLLGWLEDLPAGVAYEWAFRGATLGKRSTGIFSKPVKHKERYDRTRYFRQLHCPLLAYSISDDNFGTPAAVLRLLRYYRGSDRIHVMVTPGEFALSEIGHFAFFHDRFSQNLWPESLAWLNTGNVSRQAVNFLPSEPISEPDTCRF
ncbi:Predicted alpha/beta hydrolase [Collimonas sp. OK607]|uniref:alpha/beta hydrolase family protein n=1 Tax=Collimonas sp. OK607 TaxID=1798194 RepID=UPI0008E372A6|nr:alpha/beta fold hydrolase [Collimonas sp. OK607]SFA85874.1 Predicted alpha/beta hydrolase [Collimonas sp. OK607]